MLPSDVELISVPNYLFDLRWGCVLLAAFGLYLAAARRTGPTLAAIVLCGWLIGADVVLQRTSLAADARSTLSFAALAAVIGAALAWRIAGRPGSLTPERALAVRRGLAAVAVAAAACGPLQLPTRPCEHGPEGN
jgi:hypothetical protein